MPNELPRIKRIKLSNGQTYSIFDQGALRLNENHQLVTGNAIVDNVIIQQGLHITLVDDVPVEESIENVLVQDPQTGEIKKRDTDILLEDIGGASYNMNSSTGVLSLKIGKWTT